MKNNWRGDRTPMFLVWPMLLGAVGLWLWLARRDSVPGLMGAAALIVTVVLGIGWLSRARSARRLLAALDAYAEREIDRERQRNGPQRIRSASVRVGA
jgi:hypothetical protein